jgi:hypothetical protein
VWVWYLTEKKTIQSKKKFTKERRIPNLCARLDMEKLIGIAVRQNHFQQTHIRVSDISKMRQIINCTPHTKLNQGHHHDYSLFESKKSPPTSPSPPILLATERNKTTPAEPGSSSMLSPGGTLLRANCYKQTLSTSSISQQILHY